ncbi:MAG TPA: DUF5666 domain-containing protein [Candidatus Saccharimonadales bacterium]|jgi:hypothetical protein|nr:DUF5666 domain-containing protein [Candidatus Saccharimonadales bacterium]
MKDNKYINLFAGGLLALTGFYKVNQINPSIMPIATPTPTPIIKPINPNLGKLRQIQLEFTNKRGELDNVKVTAKDASSITIDNGGVSVKVDVATNTHFRRKFWGSSDINEISVGDSVDVIGRWTNEGKTEINAVVIRDISIQKRFGEFFGTVKSITDTGFVMTTIQRGEETVTLDPTTKLINRKGQAIATSDIQVGQIIRVRGLWDSVNFTVTEVAEVKDFSLPPFATPAATP